MKDLSMIQKSVQRDTDLASALLDIVPKVLRRLRADVPLDSDASEMGPVLREVSELRATPGQLSLLRILVEHKRCTMQEIAEHLAVTPSTATAMVKRLLEKGYIERSRGDTDWRTVWIKATERGLQAVTVYDYVRLNSLRHRLERLSEQERQSLTAALPALRHLIEVE
jgi:DNA-binding MarR family transcriptional regulator